MKTCKYFFILMCLFATTAAAQRVVDVVSRTGVTQRFVLITPEKVKAAVILFAGGDGGIQIAPGGAMTRFNGNFLVRTRERFASQGLITAVVDAPSDRQQAPFLSGFRQSPEHVQDIKAVIAWLKKEFNVPVWLVGTSRGTQSVAHIGTQAAPEAGGPDGLILTSTILTDAKGRPVPDMPLDRLAVPVLVVHHRNDGCKQCWFSDMPRLTRKLAHLKKTELLTFEGGDNVGDPCEARAYHGFNGIESEVLGKIAAWISGG
jgi:pimeloyl-ACP methyl ester carboxylesterase